jgi:hypothetical protein
MLCLGWLTPAFKIQVSLKSGQPLLIWRLELGDERDVISVGQCQVVREATVELYIRRLRPWSLDVFYERIVCLTHLLFSSLYLVVKRCHGGEL